MIPNKSLKCILLYISKDQTCKINNQFLIVLSMLNKQNHKECMKFLVTRNNHLCMLCSQFQLKLMYRKLHKPFHNIVLDLLNLEDNQICNFNNQQIMGCDKLRKSNSKDYKEFQQHFNKILQHILYNYWYYQYIVSRKYYSIFLN